MYIGHPVWTYHFSAMHQLHTNSYYCCSAPLQAPRATQAHLACLSRHQASCLHQRPCFWQPAEAALLWDLIGMIDICMLIHQVLLHCCCSCYTRLAPLLVKGVMQLAPVVCFFVFCPASLMHCLCYFLLLLLCRCAGMQGRFFMALSVLSQPSLATSNHF